MTPLLPLDLFRHHMQMHPFHFWQLANSAMPVSAACSSLVYQHAWQDADAVGRSDILQAIETAENRLREWLGYSVAPHYVTETLTWPQYYRVQFQNWGPAGVDGHWRTIQLSEGYLQNFGVETLTLITANAAVAYSDVDADGIDEVFTVTVNTAITDIAQIALYFVAADILPGIAGERIQPISVTFAAGVATIKGRAWTMVKPRLYQGLTQNPFDPDTVGVLATTVNVYQRTTSSDTTTPQATLIWDTQPWPACCVGGMPDSGSSADPNAIGTTSGRLGITDSRRGIAHGGQATYNADTGLWTDGGCGCWRNPDRITARYYAGLPLGSDGLMDAIWQVIVARLAAAELARPICACQQANRAIYHWQEDLARTGGNNDSAFGLISAEDLNNPFGTRRGHIYAWRQVNHLRLGRGLFVG